jgi:hypothetical protein
MDFQILLMIIDRRGVSIMSTLFTNRRHSFKNRTGDRTGEAIGLGFYRSDHWFTGSLSGFLR